MKTAIPIALTLVFTALILTASYLVKKSPFLLLHNNQYINFQINFQVMLLFLTVISLAISYALNKSSFINYFSIGDISAPAKELKLFGIKQGDSWLKTGLSLCVVISIVTGLFMYFQIKELLINWSVLQNGIIWILLFSLTNSFSEEMIYRLGIVSPLSGIVTPSTVFILSAVLFGVPHYFGMPSGIIGAFMASILGYVLAKSIHETNGIFWAWLIHFIQDIIIIGSLFLLSNKVSNY